MHYPIAFIFIFTTLALKQSYALEPTYARYLLNDYLEKAVRSDDIDTNFSLIREAIAGKRPIPHKGTLLRKVQDNLKSFLELENLRSDEECTRRSFQILKNNNDVNGDNAHQAMLDIQHLNRIDKILHQVMREHAKSCREKHFLNFKDTYDKQDPYDLEAVRTMFTKLITHKPESLNWQKLTYRDVIVVYLLPALENLAKDESTVVLLRQLSEQKWVSSEEREYVTNLINEFLLEPCDNIVADLSDIFEVSRFDDIMVPISQGSPDKKLYEETFRLFTMCQKVTGHWREQTEQFFSKVVRTLRESYNIDIPRI